MGKRFSPDKSRLPAPFRDDQAPKRRTIQSARFARMLRLGIRIVDDARNGIPVLAVKLNDICIL